MDTALLTINLRLTKPMKRTLPPLAILAVIVLCLYLDYDSHRSKSIAILDLTISKDRLEKDNARYQDSLKQERGFHFGLNDK